MNSVAKRMIIIAFVLIILCPVLLWFFIGTDYEGDNANNENRVMAEKPIFSLSEYTNFSSNYENYFNDTLPFRSDLIKLNSRINYYLFSHSSSSDVLIGKDGWLFYNAVADGNPIADYMGTELPTEEWLATTAQNLTNVRDELAKENCEFVLFVAPNKSHVYGEYVPDVYGGEATDYFTKVAVDYLKENTDLHIVYAADDLLEAKEFVGEDILYHKADTHWNNLGAYVGATALLEELDISIPKIGTDAKYQARENDLADLGKMLGMEEDFLHKESNYEITSFDPGNLETEKWEFETEFIYHNKGADPRRLYVVRDSFSSAMSDYVAAQFDESYWIRSNMYTVQNLKDYHPDIVVYETCERYFRYVPGLQVTE